MTNPNAVYIEHDVANFDTWKTHYLDHAPARGAATVTSELVTRADDDRSKVIIYLAFDSFDAARGFIDSPDTVETMQRAGVTQAPRITFCETMRSNSHLDRELPAFLLRHDVQDFDKWLSAYDSLDGLRASFGIIGDTVSRSGSDGNEVIVYHQAKERASLEKFLDSPELREAMSRAGVVGPREVTFVHGEAPAANAPDPSHIMQIGMGFFASKALLSAVGLGLFTALGEKPMNAAQIAESLGLKPRSVPDFPDALVSLGFLERDGSGEAATYSNSGDAAVFLDRNSPHYIGGLLEMANERLYGFWDGLTDALQTGRAQNETKDGGESIFTQLYADPKKLEQFMSAMAGVSAGNFAAFTQKFDFSNYETFCDVGGATGQLACMVAATQEHLDCKTFDLPPVEPIATRTIEAAGLEGRVEALAGDFFVDDLPQADLITMGMVLHDWNLEQKKMLIKKAYDALPEGGAFVAIESLIDDDRRENAFGLLMSLNMLIEFGEKGGFDYTGADFDGWCREAGFKRTEVLHLAGPASAAIAYK